MKKYILLLILLFIANNDVFAQNLNGYKYVVVQNPTYQSGGVDVWNISSNLVMAFRREGFMVVKESNELPKEINDNWCSTMFCFYEHTNNTIGSNSVTLVIMNCKEEVIYKNTGSATGFTLQDDYRKATDRAFAKIKESNYKFDPSKTPIIVIPPVEKTNETESSLTTYFDNAASLDAIEGIYKSYQSDGLGYYKIGIKKFGNIYKAIIIESDAQLWNKGEVKAIFENSSMNNFYSTKWYMGNKYSYETFANLKNPALLSIEFKNPQTGVKREDFFVKMYPSTSSNNQTADNSLTSTGSGIIISTNGIIATNAHVIGTKTKIEVVLSSDIGVQTYKVKILLKDDNNDVALLQIDDENFTELEELPFTIVERSDIGEDVFTIGYPLSDIMGNNYKVTNGIISALSGIKDDIRYLQTTTPIQPGNSGGALFNKEGNIVGLTTSKLNEEAVGMSIQNVNYAIKANYILNLYKMLPNQKTLSNNNIIKGKELKEQIKILRNYVCLIKVY